MAIKRYVRINCDGPCGTVLPENIKHAPADWDNLSYQAVHTEKGKTPARRKRAVLCASCAIRALGILRSHGFEFVDAPANEDET